MTKFFDDLINGWTTNWAVQIIHFLSWLANWITNQSEPDILSSWFVDYFRLGSKIAVMLIVPLALLGALTAVLKGGMSELVRTFLIGLPLAFFGSAVAIAFVWIMLQIDNDLVQGVYQMSNQSWVTYTQHLQSRATLISNIGVGVAFGFLWAIMAVILLFFIMVLFLEMFLRNIMLYMAILFAPVAMAAFVWSGARKWITELIEITVSMVFVRFIISAVLELGSTIALAAFSGNPVANDQNSSALQLLGMMLAGCVAMFMAVAAPAAILAFVLHPQHQDISRKELQDRLPTNYDRIGIRRNIAGLFKLGKGG